MVYSLPLLLLLSLVICTDLQLHKSERHPSHNQNAAALVAPLETSFLQGLCGLTRHEGQRAVPARPQHAAALIALACWLAALRAMHADEQACEPVTVACPQVQH